MLQYYIRQVTAAMVERAINPVLSRWGLEADVYVKYPKPGAVEVRALEGP